MLAMTTSSSSGEEEHTPLVNPSSATPIKKSWKIALGVLGLVVLGVVGLSRPAVGQHLDTANNILRRYRCPPGGYPAGRNAKGDCLCLKCPVGHRCPGGYRGRIPCSRGFYQDVTGQNSCKKSTPGYHAPRPGAPSLTPCPPGFYQPGIGKWSCIPASPGRYVPRPKMTKQMKCKRGFYQNERGQAKCKPAPRGTYVMRRGRSRPTPCNFGTFNNQVGQRRCIPARPGRFVSARGQKSDSPCAKNTFQHCRGQPLCIQCPQGWVSKVGARRCRPGWRRRRRKHRKFPHVNVAGEENVAAADEHDDADAEDDQES